MAILRDAMARPDRLGAVVTATVSQLYLDGTVQVDLGAGRTLDACAVLAVYTPAIGDTVQVMRRDESSWLVLGPTRTANAATVQVGNALSFPFNVAPGAPGGSSPLVVSAASNRSWRNNEGWGGPEAAQVAQGAYSTRWGYYRGLWFYGSSAFSSLAGATCTSLTLHVARTSSGGIAGAEAIHVALHAHASQPGGTPAFVTSAITAGSVAWGASADLTLPASWGQMLIDGKARGVGLLYLGTSDYAVLNGVAADSTSGRLTIGWS